MNHMNPDHPDPEYNYECQEIKSKIDQNEEM